MAFAISSLVANSTTLHIQEHQKHHIFIEPYTEHTCVGAAITHASPLLCLWASAYVTSPAFRSKSFKSYHTDTKARCKVHAPCPSSPCRHSERNTLRTHRHTKQKNGPDICTRRLERDIHNVAAYVGQYDFVKSTGWGVHLLPTYHCTVPPKGEGAIATR